MKALSKKRIAQIREKESREANEKREAMLNAMSPEERDAFLAAEDKRAKKALAALALSYSMVPKTYR